MSIVNDAASWYFSRSRAETMMVNASAYGIPEEDDDSDREPDEDSDIDSSDQSDYETRRRRKKKKKPRHAKEIADPKPRAALRSALKTEGTADEVTGLIRQLNKMSIDDPEYSPVFYKVLTLDQTGIAAKCVQPPRISQHWNEYSRVPSRNQNRTANINNATLPTMPAAPPTTYPNNIPLRSTTPEIRGCYGCNREGHRMNECPELQALLQAGTIGYDGESSRLRLKDGTIIRRQQGESISEAVARLIGPKVMFSTYDSEHEGLRGQETYFMNPERAQFINSYSVSESEHLIEDSDSGYQTELLAATIESSADTGPDDERPGRRVYLTLPKKHQDRNYVPQVQSAERTVPTSRNVRREIFDGVQMPSRDEVRNRPKKMIGRELGAPKSPDARSSTLPAKSSPEPLPELRPVDARQVRFDVPKIDVDMPPVSLPKTDKNPKRRESESAIKTRIPTPGPEKEEPVNGNTKNSGRQSELQTTVDVNGVLDRLLNLSLPLSVGEAFALSKEIRNGIQEKIRLKNVKAVLIGRSASHPILANWTWQRTEGVLIKVEMEVANRKIMAIIDTGSQLDVVRADIAALIIQRPVDMTCTTNMNDANGGKGQLRGRIDEVEFKCGGVSTKTDLWVSQQAPFELLLGCPWQRSNLVSIDEREEGTYLVFKDPETRRPRYELLAIPHDASAEAYHFLRPPDSLAYISEALHGSQGTFVPLKPPPPNQDPNNLKAGDRARCTASMKCKKVAFELICESVQLLQVILAILSLIIGTILVFGELAVCKVLEWGVIEKKAAQHDIFQTNCPIPTALFSSISPSHLLHPSAMTEPAPDKPRPPADKSQVLDRQRYGSYGLSDEVTIDAEHDDVLEYIADREWLAHLYDDKVHVRPGFLAAPQTFYLGKTVQKDGQETHQGVMLNARMLIHNSDTGAPGSQNGHAHFVFKAAPAHEDETWNLEVPYAPEATIRTILGHYVDLGANLDVAADDSCVRNLDELEEGLTQSQDPDILDLNTAPTLCSSPEPLLSLPGMISPSTRRRYRYIHFPDDRAPPFDVSHMERIGTTRGETVMRFRLRDDGPAVSAADTKPPARFDTPVSPYCLMYACPPLDPLETRPSPSPLLEEDGEEGAASPRKQSRYDVAHPCPDAVYPRHDVVYPRYPVARETVERVADVLAPSASSSSPAVDEAERARLRLRKRKELFEEGDGAERKKQVLTAPPPATALGTSVTDRLSAPVFRSRGPVISRARYSSSPDLVSSDAPITYDQPLVNFDDAITEMSVCSDDSDAEPRLIIDTAVREAQRQLAREQPRDAPFVGMIVAQPPPSPPRLDAGILAPTAVPDRSRSPAASDRPLFTWTPLPKASLPPTLSVSTNAAARAPLPATRPTTLFDEYLKRVRSPRPSSPLQHRRITQELANEHVFHELRRPVLPTSPDSDSSMPSLRTVDSFEHVERAPSVPREFIPAAAQSVHAEPSHTPYHTLSQLPVESVSADELKAEIARIHDELPHDEKERRRSMWHHSEQWNWDRRQQIKLFRHNQLTLVKKPLEDIIYIVTHFLTDALDYAAMSQLDFELMQYIGRLPSHISADEVIRLKSRIVCAFVDVARPHTYHDDLDEALQTIDSMAFDAPDGQRRVEVPTSIPSSPRGDLFRDRVFSLYAVRKGTLFMAAIKALYDQEPSLFSHISDLRVCILEGLRLLARYTGQRLWEVDISVLHRTGPSPLPFLHDFEYAQLRLLGDCCDAFGDAEVYDLIDRLSRLRFRKNSLITHMLHSGFLDPIYDDHQSSGWGRDTPSDFAGADIFGNARSSASFNLLLTARSSELRSFYQPVEREFDASSNISAASNPAHGRSSSAPPAMDRQSIPTCSHHERVYANYRHECANHTFSTCRPLLRNYPLATDA
ncbi:hypothetical protein C8J57DRAFT_1714176 [Mycena rebaudengoi]|nr:hypothetical protein C8J57DRAFT_1714176 [Mycena rebaudengoi]